MARNWWEESYFTDDQKSDAEPKKIKFFRLIFVCRVLHEKFIWPTTIALIWHSFAHTV